MKYLMYFLLFIFVTSLSAQSNYSLDSIRAIEIYHDAVGDGYPKDLDYTIKMAKKSIAILDSLGKIKFDSTLFHVMAEQMFAIGFLKKMRDDPFEEVYPILKKTLDTVSSVFGERHFLATKCMFKIGHAYLIKGDIVKGYEYLNKGIKIRKETLPKNDIFLAYAYSNLNNYYLYVEDPFQAELMTEKFNSILGHLLYLKNKGVNDQNALSEFNNLIHKDRYPIIESPYLNDYDNYHIQSLIGSSNKYFRYDEYNFIKNIINEIDVIIENNNTIPKYTLELVDFIKGRYYLGAGDTLLAKQHFINIINSKSASNQLYTLISKTLMDETGIANYHSELSQINYSDVSSYSRDDIIYLLTFYFLRKKNYPKAKEFLNNYINFRKIDTLYVQFEKDSVSNNPSNEIINMVNLSGCLIYYGINSIIDNEKFHSPTDDQILFYDNHLLKFEKTVKRLLNSQQSYESNMVTAERMQNFFDAAINLSVKLYSFTGKNKYKDIAVNLSDLLMSMKLEFSMRLKRYFYSNEKDDYIRIKDIAKQIILNEEILREELKKNKNPQKISRIQNQLFNLNKEYEAQLLSLKQSKSLIFNYSELDVNELLSTAKEKKLNFLEYFVGKKNIIIFHISDDGLEIHDVEKQTLDEDIHEYLNLIKENPSLHKQNNTEKIINHSNKIYSLLLPPAIDETLTSENLVIIPSGIISYLPFESLIYDKTNSNTFRNQKYLIQKVNITYDFSLEVLLNETKKEKKKSGFKYLGFAPSYSSNKIPAIENEIFLDESFGSTRDFGPLKYNKEEILNTASLFSGAVRVDSFATEQNFKIDAYNANILHLAMHGVTNDKYPEYSFLAFNNQNDTIEDGQLFAYEIENMDLSADLVVLSACNTGFGKYRDGEGILSLSRSFKQSGVKNIVLSLWNANDYSSTEIMNEYFNNLHNSMPSTNSLREAKLKFLEKTEDENFTHPYYWATFLHFGSNDLVFEENNLFNSKWIIIIFSSLILLSVIGFKLKTNYLSSFNN
jgi:CHAT domain-containing protein